MRGVTKEKQAGSPWAGSPPFQREWEVSLRPQLRGFLLRSGGLTLQVTVEQKSKVS